MAIRSLSLTNYAPRKEPRSSTRCELLEEIRQWVNDLTHEHVYWLQGKAGTGKSTIARTVVHDFADRDCLAASFFFKRNESDCGIAGCCFATIAAQLVQRLPAVAEHVQNARSRP
ncbi:hypothetical protein FOMA001_g7516 [Fusarium oxysporum f. sp. matthiolae]|nr:hypothetical protein FOMA001_g7516 [Fusarium oxysporum f. sp. matthiolae]